MRDDGWRRLDDDALEQVLIERWVYRGILLGVVFLAAAIVTYLGSQGATRPVDWITIGVMLAVAISATAVAFVMRQTDRRMHQELRRRRRAPGG
jgi:O-antigen ligase